MEKEVKIEEKPTPRNKRRISLFRRRKKANIRPFVKDRKQREYKKILSRVFLAIIALFIASFLLFAVRVYVIPAIFSHNKNILTPLGTKIPDNVAVKNQIQSMWSDATDVNFATDSAVVTFVLSKRTSVILTTEKDIPVQLSLVEAIDKQMTSSGRQAISIDLRYNKPIVKF